MCILWAHMGAIGCIGLTLKISSLRINHVFYANQRKESEPHHSKASCRYRSLSYHCSLIAIYM